MTLEQDEAKGRVHRRYTLAPKSEIRVTGPGAVQLAPATEPAPPQFQSLPTPIAPEGGILPLTEPPALPAEIR